jgi:hypothetical protein
MKRYTLFIVALFTALSSYAVAPITGPTTVCAGDTIILSDATTGGTWSSSATATATVGTSGFVIGVAAGVATISYTSGGSTATISVTVNALPMLSSSLTPPTMCDSTVFNYVPTSSTPGLTFSWTLPAITGIFALSSSGTGNPDEELINNTANPISVVYRYSMTGGGCPNTEDVSVVVNPTPVLSSALTLPDICDSTAIIHYTPASPTPGATFAWDRPTITGITPATGFASAGAGVITETLTDVANRPITVTYFYRLAIGACTNLYTQTVTVKIDTCVSLATTIPAKGEPLEITPNPTTDKITISNLQPGDEVEIFSTLGKKVFTQKQLSGSSIMINLTTEPTGVYFVRINSVGNIQTQKIVKQ